MRRSRKAVCHICWGEDIKLDFEGCLELHHERIVSRDGPAKGGFVCAGSGEPPQEVIR